METSWQNITRRLDINKVSRDTTYDKTHSKGRAVRKIPQLLTVPAITFNPISDFGLALFASLPSVILAQFNYTLSADFKLLAPRLPLITGMSNALPVMCVRYRIGTIVYRYIIPYSAATINFASTLQQQIKLAVPLYSGQLIKKNCVIEYYTLSGVAADADVTYPELSLTTNRLSVPSSDDEQSTTVAPVESLLRSDITVAMPEGLPTVYPTTIAWLDNP